jgi:hypothetical protein
VWCLSNKEEKKTKEEGGQIVLSESASAELEAIDLFYSICVQKLQRQGQPCH